MENASHIHVFTDTVVPSTCKETGYTLHRCECGYEHKDNFKPLGYHNFEKREETAPTCVEGGSATYVCSVCDETRTEELSPLGHYWSEWSTQVFPTCNEEGSDVRICQRCGAREEMQIPPKGHKLTSPKESETEKGAMEYFCENCGETIIVPAEEIKKKRRNKRLITAAIGVVLAACLVLLTVLVAIPHIRYMGALNDIEDGNYKDAYYTLLDINECCDSRNLIKHFQVEYEESENKNTTYDENGEEVVTTSKYLREYDEKGNLLSDKRYSDGVLVDHSEYKYEYDKKGEDVLGSSLETNYDENGQPDYQFGYDENGNKILWKSWEDGVLKYHTEHEYDEHGNEILYKSFDENGVLEYEHEYVNEYEYHKNGKVSRCVQYEDEDKEFEKRYDEAGNEIYYVSYSYDGTILNHEEWEYYDNGNEKLWKSYNVNGVLERCSEYNKNGDIVCSRSYDENGNEASRTEYKYDDCGNRILAKEYDENSKVTGWTECEYDEFNVPMCYVAYDENGSVLLELKIEIKYNSDGLPVEMSSFDEDGKLLGEVEMEYGDDLVKTKTISYDDTGKKTRISETTSKGIHVFYEEEQEEVSFGFDILGELYLRL